jgi:hypothetical protein
MKEITVLIDEEGNSSVDLTGFTDGSCAAAMHDFQGDDRVVSEQRKPEYYRHTNKEQHEQQRQRR